MQDAVSLTGRTLPVRKTQHRTTPTQERTVTGGTSASTGSKTDSREMFWMRREGVGGGGEEEEEEEEEEDGT